VLRTLGKPVIPMYVLHGGKTGLTRPPGVACSVGDGGELRRKKTIEAPEELDGQRAQQLTRIVDWTEQEKRPEPERRLPVENVDDAASSAA
jgi:hypothetical protein